MFKQHYLLLFLVSVISSLRAENLEVFNNRLFIPIHVNGISTKALLDSGSEMTLIDEQFAYNLGLNSSGEKIKAKGSGGSAEVSFINGLHIQALNVSLKDITVAVMDLSELSNRLIGRNTSVILGREIFDSQRIQIDINQATIQTLSKDTVPSGYLYKLNDYLGLKHFNIQLGKNKSVKAAFDLGNGSEPMVSQFFVETNHLLSDSKLMKHKTGGGIGGAVSRPIINIENLKIAGLNYPTLEVVIDQTDSASPMNIGVSLLKDFVITVDFQVNKLWLLSKKSKNKFQN